MIHIYLDAMGGDEAPRCTVEGAKEAIRKHIENQENSIIRQIRLEKK